MICVVEEPSDVIPVERTHEFRGRYHVLGGALSPIDGVDPEDLRIAELLERVEAGGVREVVVATNSTTTGEATALYLADTLRERAPDVTVTRLASGLPVGADLEYADEVTLGKAFRGRRELRGRPAALGRDRALPLGSERSVGSVGAPSVVRARRLRAERLGRHLVGTRRALTRRWRRSCCCASGATGRGRGAAAGARAFALCAWPGRRTSGSASTASRCRWSGGLGAGCARRLHFGPSGVVATGGGHPAAPPPPAPSSAAAAP